MRETKWIIGEECRMGPFESQGVSIPFFDRSGRDAVWFFAFSEKKAYPPHQVFNTAQEAALAAIAANGEKVRFIGVETKQLQDWCDEMEARRLELAAKEKAIGISSEGKSRRQCAPKDASCPVCHRTIGLVKGRFARHNWWPHGRKSPCGGSGREIATETKAATIN